MQVQELKNTAATAEVVEILQQDGCVVVRNLVAESLMEAIYDELKPFIEATKFGRDDFAGFRTQRTGSLVARSQSFPQLVMHPLVLDTAAKVLGPHCQKFQLHLTQVIKIDPAEPAQRNCRASLGTAWEVMRWDTLVIPNTPKRC